MKETSKTIAFVVSALALTGLAGVTWQANRPQVISDFGSIGQPFFEDFTSNKQATNLEVVALDEKGARRRFQVRKQGEVWTIPSHYDYPAEAADRLTKTASAVIGLRREALAGRNAAEHERYGVLDPDTAGSADAEAVGKRLVLKDSSGNTLADFILGKEAAALEDDQDRAAFERDRTEKFYYVRRADENLTYKVKLDLNLSTRFADWIDPALLQIEESQLVKMGIDDYQLREEAADPLGSVRTLSKVAGKPSTLTRKTGFDPWTLEGIDQAKFELDAAKAGELTQTVVDLKIVGVRPKFKWNGKQLLTADLELITPTNLQNGSPEFEQFQEAVLTLQDELSSRGFQFAKKGEQLILVSEAGEFLAGTEDGVAYTLQFGKPVDGTEEAIEIGKGNDKSTEVGENSAEGEAAKKEAAAAPESTGKNRYVMIRVSVDPALLGGQPVAPVEPTKPVQPEGYVPRPAPAQPAEGEAASAPQPETPDTRDAKFIEYDAQLKAWEEARTTFELEKTQHEMKLKEFDEKLKAAQKRVAELNDRYGNWYYVVSAENLAGLLVKRTELEKPKAPPADALPERPNINFEESDVPPAPPVIDPASGESAGQTGGEQTPPPAQPAPENKAEGEVQPQPPESAPAQTLEPKLDPPSQPPPPKDGGGQ